MEFNVILEDLGIDKNQVFNPNQAVEANESSQSSS